MRTIILSAAVAAVLAYPAHAAPPRSALEGSEVHRSARVGQFTRSEVIRLAPDGTFTGVYHSRRPTMQGGYDRRQGTMRGRWSLQGDALCLTGSGLADAGQNCFRLSKSNSTERHWSAADTRTGDVWQVFVYSGDGDTSSSRAAR